LKVVGSVCWSTSEGAVVAVVLVFTGIVGVKKSSVEVVRRTKQLSSKVDAGTELELSWSGRINLTGGRFHVEAHRIDEAVIRQTALDTITLAC